MWWISVLLDRVSVFSIIIFLRCVFLTIFFRREMLRIEKTVALCRNCSLLFLNVLIFLIFPDYLFFFFFNAAPCYDAEQMFKHSTDFA